MRLREFLTLHIVNIVIFQIIPNDHERLLFKEGGGGLTISFSNDGELISAIPLQGSVKNGTDGCLP